MNIQRASFFTNNRWKQGTGSVLSSYNPATGELLWQSQEASEDNVNETINNAQKAFESWSNLAINERSRYLSDFSEILKDSKQVVAETISKETGKPLWDALLEVNAMIQKLEISLEAYGHRCAGMIKDFPHARSITRHRPHGVVAVLGPYNFPGHLPNGHIIPALLAGNTVVFKPSELTPLVAQEIFSCWQKVDLPPGVLNLVQGGIGIGKVLINHAGIQGLFFTGSYQTGLYLSETFGAYPNKILALEMGGNNPLIVSQIEDLKAAAYTIIQSAYLSSGQRCTCARRLLLVENEQTHVLIDTLINMMQTINIGAYTDSPEPFMGPVITEKHALSILETEKNLQSQGGEVLVLMQHLKTGTGFINPGLMDTTSISNRPDEEIFGPFLQIIRVKNLKEAIREANHTKFGLTAGLLSDRQEEYDQFYQHILAGVVNWNTPLTGASSAAPFGGIKRSGNHRPSAYYTADYCSYPVASFETAKLQMPSMLTPGLYKFKTPLKQN